MEAIVVSIANQKGGVSKTTTATLLAVGLARKGFKVLALDADSQGNMTKALHADKSDDAFCLADLMQHIRVRDDDGTERNIETGDAIQHTDYCDVIASNAHTAKAAENFDDGDKLFFISDLIDPLRASYDFIVLDTGPAKDLMIKNCLVASDGVIIPTAPGKFAQDGIEAMADTLRQARHRNLNPGLKLFGILMTQYQVNNIPSRESLSKVGELANTMNTKLFETAIRMDVNVSKSQMAAIPEEKKSFPSEEGIILYDFAPNTRAAKDYMTFVDEFLMDLKIEVPDAKEN